MKLIIDRSLKNAESVRTHPLFGKAVIIECGLHDPEHFCYDHHNMNVNDQWMLSSCEMIYREMLLRRKMPEILIMNHSRHLDNLLSVFLLFYPDRLTNPDVLAMVASAGISDRLGPAAEPALSQMHFAVLVAAREMIPFKESDLSDEELQQYTVKAIEALAVMVTAPKRPVHYTVLWESNDKKFAIVHSDEAVGNSLYDVGYDAYAVYTVCADGSVKWTFARVSAYVPFEIMALVGELNVLEPNWGGRPEIAGSPQPPVNSRLPIERVFGLAKKYYVGN